MPLGQLSGELELDALGCACLRLRALPDLQGQVVEDCQAWRGGGDGEQAHPGGAAPQRGGWWTGTAVGKEDGSAGATLGARNTQCAPAVSLTHVCAVLVLGRQTKLSREGRGKMPRGGNGGALVIKPVHKTHD